MQVQLLDGDKKQVFLWNSIFSNGDENRKSMGKKQRKFD
jgi:hypothetical protein